MADDKTVDRQPESGWVLIVFGVVLGAIGVLVLNVDAEDPPPEWISQGLIGFGWLVATIGAIAVGVELALDRHAWRNRHQPK